MIRYMYGVGCNTEAKFLVMVCYATILVKLNTPLSTPIKSALYAICLFTNSSDVMMQVKRYIGKIIDISNLFRVKRFTCVANAPRF